MTTYLRLEIDGMIVTGTLVENGIFDIMFHDLKNRVRLYPKDLKFTATQMKYYIEKLEKEGERT